VRPSVDRHKQPLDVTKIKICAGAPNEIRTKWLRGLVIERPSDQHSP
jgi:hypothetical protein